MKDMKINCPFLYLFRFTDKTNIRRYINTLFGGKSIKANLIFKLKNVKDQSRLSIVQEIYIVHIAMAKPLKLSLNKNV